MDKLKEAREKAVDKRMVVVESCRLCPEKMGMTTNNKYWCTAIMRKFGFKDARQAEIELDSLHPDCPLPKAIEEESMCGFCREGKVPVEKKCAKCGADFTA